MKALLLAPMGSVHRRFNSVNIKTLQSLGYEVHLVANFEKGEGTEQQNQEFVDQCANAGIITHSLSYQRHEIKQNIKLIKPTKELIYSEKYDIVHAHTETGGLILRLVGKIQGEKFFTPHGMSFYKGAPLKAQLVYRPIERWICSGMNRNIAINQEEYQILKRWNSDTARLTHGIGLEIERFQNRNKRREEIRREFGIPNDSIVVLSVGELDDNKNHKVVIDALKDSDAYYLICGIGPNKNQLIKRAASYNMDKRLILAGYRKDIPDIIGASDIFAFPSFHEGLPVSLMEAQAGGLPVVASKIRGNVDLIENHVNGYLVAPDDVKLWKRILDKLINNPKLRKKFSNASNSIVASYSQNSVYAELSEIYSLRG